MLFFIKKCRSRRRSGQTNLWATLCLTNHPPQGFLTPVTSHPVHETFCGRVANRTTTAHSSARGTSDGFCRFRTCTRPWRLSDKTWRWSVQTPDVFRPKAGLLSAVHFETGICGKESSDNATAGFLWKWLQHNVCGASLGLVAFKDRCKVSLRPFIVTTRLGDLSTPPFPRLRLPGHAKGAPGHVRGLGPT